MLRHFLGPGHLLQALWLQSRINRWITYLTRRCIWLRPMSVNMHVQNTLGITIKLMGTGETKNHDEKNYGHWETLMSSVNNLLSCFSGNCLEIMSNNSMLCMSTNGKMANPTGSILLWSFSASRKSTLNKSQQCEICRPAVLVIRTVITHQQL